MPMHRCVLPVPVPPMKITLRRASRNEPVASSRTRSSSIGVSVKTNLPISLEDREFGVAHAIADRAGLPVSTFGADQAGEEGKDLIAPGKTFASDLVEAGAHAVELEFGHGLEDLMALHQATFLMLS